MQNPPQDAASDAKAKAGAPDAADPKGTFGGPGGTAPTIVSQATNNGTTTTTYSNGTIVITYPDGSSKTTTSDGTVTWNIPGVETNGVVDTGGEIDPGGVTAPGQPSRRIGWRELRR